MKNMKYFIGLDVHKKKPLTWLKIGWEMMEVNQHEFIVTNISINHSRLCDICYMNLMERFILLYLLSYIRLCFFDEEWGGENRTREKLK